ncbi:MAG: ribosome maturation factor RimM [Acidimicrobiia bacterium]
MPESNSSTEPRFVVGRLGRPHGLDGHIGLYVDEDDLVHFEPGKSIFVEDRQFEVASIRRADRGHHLKLVGINTRVAAEAIRGNNVIATERRELGAEEYWPDELIGLEVRDDAGNRVGDVADLVTGGAQDRLVVDAAGGRFEVPFVAALVQQVDVAGGFVVIAPIEGLIEPSV